MEPTSDHGQGLPTGKPEDEGFSSTRLERLKAVMQSNPAGWGFGLGIPVRRDVAQSEITGTTGELTNCGAASTYFCIDPQEQLVSLLMTQFFPAFHYPILRQMKVLTYQALVD